MDILYLLIPLSAVLILAIVGVFGWAVHAGQFDDVDREGERLLDQADGEASAPAPAMVTGDQNVVAPAR